MTSHRDVFPGSCAGSCRCPMLLHDCCSLALISVDQEKLRAPESLFTFNGFSLKKTRGEMTFLSPRRCLHLLAISYSVLLLKPNAHAHNDNQCNLYIWINALCIEKLLYALCYMHLLCALFYA